MTGEAPFDEQELLPAVSAEEYNAFIGQINLDKIWLRSSRLTNSSLGDMQFAVTVTIDDSHKWSETDDGFQVFHKYVVEFSNEKKRKLARIEAEFGLDYNSGEPMTDEYYEIFAENNLPLNSWPYLREYLSSTITRMGWLPFTLPARKIGGRSAQPDETDE